jgi:hypothetical protein
VASLLVGAASLLAFAPPSRSGAGRNPYRPVPAPAFRSFASASRADLLRYAKSLAFDTSYHAIDTRRLMLRKDAKFETGPMTTVAPEIGVTSMTFDEMRAGRIVARLTADGPFPAQGFATGENFVWVDNVRGHLRAVIIPADPNVPTSEFGYGIMHEKINPPGSRPEARFRWDERSGLEWIWIPCDSGCCLVQDGRPRPPR